MITSLKMDSRVIHAVANMTSRRFRLVVASRSLDGPDGQLRLRFIPAG